MTRIVRSAIVIVGGLFSAFMVLVLINRWGLPLVHTAGGTSDRLNLAIGAAAVGGSAVTAGIAWLTSATRSPSGTADHRTAPSHASAAEARVTPPPGATTYRISDGSTHHRPLTMVTSELVGKRRRRPLVATILIVGSLFAVLVAPASSRTTPVAVLLLAPVPLVYGIALAVGRRGVILQFSPEGVRCRIGRKVLDLPWHELAALQLAAGKGKHVLMLVAVPHANSSLLLRPPTMSLYDPASGTIPVADLTSARIPEHSIRIALAAWASAHDTSPGGASTPGTTS